MANWRDHIFQEFTPELSRLTLVADPDGLLTEEGVQQGIRERGFELIPFEDPIAFRYAYESKYRSLWDHGIKTELVVALRTESNSLRHLPYDLLKTGRTLAFSLPTIFPQLSYPVLQLLKPAELELLYSAQTLHGGSTLGDRATKDFILDHVFDFFPKPNWQPKNLLRALLRRHYRKQDIAFSFDARIIELLRNNHAFDAWPLEEIVPDRERFLAFLQANWPRFLELYAAARSGERIRQLPSAKLDLPFDSEDVRTYIDNYFVEGLLTPVSHPELGSDRAGWVRIGIAAADPQELLTERFEKLRCSLADQVPDCEARYQDWQLFAPKWAELNVLRGQRHKDGTQDGKEEFLTLREKVDTNFSRWLLAKYAGLAAQSPSPPVMVHHVPRYLARVAEACDCRVALIVIDALALDQWAIIRETLAKSLVDVSIHESSAFAWIPTLTPVSRQAIFAGKPPFYFPSAINITAKEEMYWKAFWADTGLPEPQTHFVKITNKRQPTAIIELLPFETSRALGVVLTTLDEMLHGTVLGMPQLHASIRLWASNGSLMQIMRLLLQHDFRVLITADHGNIEAAGIGNPREGMLAEVRGERVRIYPDEILRRKIAKNFPGSTDWPQIGIPQDYYPLIAPHRAAFIATGEVRICHGGTSLEEVLVPLIEFQPRSKSWK